jgi:hypothetical protein
MKLKVRQHRVRRRQVQVQALHEQSPVGCCDRRQCAAGQRATAQLPLIACMAHQARLDAVLPSHREQRWA